MGISERDGAATTLKVGEPALSSRPEPDERALLDPNAFTRNKLLLNLMPTAIYVCAASGELTCFNEMAVALWGRRPRLFDNEERFCGAHRLYRSDGQWMERSETPMAAVLRTGAPVKNGEAILERPDGSRITVQVNIRPLMDESGATIGAINSFQDVTELRRAQEDRERLVTALEQAVRARDEFLDVASHELRTPITTLTLQADALLRSLSMALQGEETGEMLSPARLAGRARTVRAQLTRLSALVESISDASRIVAGNLELTLENVELAAVVEDVTRRLAERARELDATVEVRAEPGIIGVWDRSRLDQVVMNLIDNALKFGRGRPVEVRVAKTGATALLSVRDAGIGIDPQDHERIFGRFERAISAWSYGGLGLGLWISKSLVAAMGGRISVESRPGEGATFTVELPARAAEQPQ
jgi:PAS domain S-box-containing protein